MRTLLDNPPRPPGEPPSPKRKLAAILHADVAGFSRLMGEDEAGTHQALNKLRSRRRPADHCHGGRIVGTAGDSVLADFSSVVDALSCAVEMQRASRAVNDPIPPERRLELRIGVNLGDVIVDGDDIFGDGVNIAARLEALAQPGTVCISQTVYDQVRNKLDLDYRPLGSHRVKNIAEPIRAYAVGVSAAAPRSRRGRRLLFAAAGAGTLVVAGLIAWTLYAGAGRELLGLGAVPKPVEVASLAAPARLAGRPSIAVLPFKNLSGDAGQDFFSDGITEDVITALGRFSNLLVVAKSASFQFKGRKPGACRDRPPARRALSARWQRPPLRRPRSRQRRADRGRDRATCLVPGLRCRGQGHFRRAGGHRSSRRRRGGGEAHPLRAGTRPWTKPTENLAAYEYVLRGREIPFACNARKQSRGAGHVSARDRPRPELRRRLCGARPARMVEAVSRDGRNLSPTISSRAETLAQKALSLDPSSTTAYRLLAEINMMKEVSIWPWTTASAPSRSTRTMPTASESAAQCLIWAGRAAEAAPWLQGALRLDPTNPERPFCSAWPITSSTATAMLSRR